MAVQNTKITKEQFIEAANSGMISKDICEKFHISPNTVKAYCTKYKVKINKGVGGKPRKVHFDDEYIVAELQKGTDRGIIAEHFNVARNTLNHYIRVHDLNPANVKRRKETSEGVIERELAKAKFADPPKQPFKDVVKGQRVVDVSCLYGI